MPKPIRSGSDPPRPVPIPVGASPLDKLNAKDIPPQERFDWQPKELVAVIGQHQQRYWYPDHSPFGAWSVAWSSNGKWIASCGWSEDVPILWDAQTMQELAMPNFKPEARMRETYANERVAFSPDSKTLVISRGKKIWLLDLTKTPPTVREELNCPGFVYEFAISFDGAILAARDSSQAVRWDLTGAKPLPPIKPADSAEFDGIWQQDARLRLPLRRVYRGQEIELSDYPSMGSHRPEKTGGNGSIRREVPTRITSRSARQI